MAATLKCTNDTLEMSALDYSKASMSHIRHYRALLWTTGPLNRRASLKYQTGKLVNGQIVYLLTSFFLSFWMNEWSQANSIMAEAITSAKNQYKSLGIALTTYCHSRARTILHWFSSTSMSLLTAVIASSLNCTYF